MDKRLAMREWGFMIPVNGMIVICFAVGEFLAGALIGAVAAKIAFGSRLGVALAIRAGWLAGFAFVILATLAGWAGSHSAFYNGRRLDTAPWGENLWWRNRIAENEFTICIISSVAAGLLGGMRLRTLREKD